MQHVSFLIGSGFSIPAGYPSTSEMNKRLCSVKAGDINIHTSMQAWFHGEDPDPNDWMRKDEREFIEALLAYYNKDD